jgi:hypothetical protein
MGRRRYGKFWGEKYRNAEPKHIHSASVNARCAWVELFALVINSEYADDGVIQLTPTLGYTDEQLAGLINMPIRSWLAAKKELVDIREIEVLDGNRIRWVRWRETQPEYERQKQLRRARYPDVTAPPNHPILPPDVTPKTGPIRERRDERVDTKTKASRLRGRSGPEELIDKARRGRNPVRQLVRDLAKRKGVNDVGTGQDPKA